jgi:hypothetical protein
LYSLKAIPGIVLFILADGDQIDSKSLLRNQRAKLAGQILADKTAAIAFVF